MARAILLLLVFSTLAHADTEEWDARGYARESTTLFFSTELSPLPTVSAQGEVSAALRIHRYGGLALAARLGGAYAFSAVGGGALGGMRIGVAAGWSFPLGTRFAFTPLLDYDLTLYWQGGELSPFVIQRVVVELPLSIVLYRHVVVEPFVQIGIAVIDGTNDLALVFGPRIGVVF